MSRKIKIRCPCGASYRVPKSSAGKKAKCRKCSTSLLIPKSPDNRSQPIAESNLAAGGFSNPYADAVAPDNRISAEDIIGSGPIDCPQCGRTIGQGKKLCIYCGYHLELGKQLETESVQAADDRTDPWEKNPDLELRDVAPGFTGFALFAGAILLIVLTHLLNSRMEGPAFLVYFFTSLVVIGVGTLLGRTLLIDHDCFNDAAILAILGVGAIRIYYSVTEERYKFMFLIIGMIVAFAVFFLSKTRGRDPEQTPFMSDSGNWSPAAFALSLAVGLFITGMIFFVPVVGKIVMQGIVFVVMGLVVAFIKVFEMVTGTVILRNSRSGYHSSCSSCGGGCGGGCGGCGG